MDSAHADFDFRPRCMYRLEICTRHDKQYAFVHTYLNESLLIPAHQDLSNYIILMMWINMMALF
jgi:hypothetical protein